MKFTFLTISAVVIAVVIAIAILIWLPKIQVASLEAKVANTKDVFKAEKDVLKAENDARTTLAQIIGGFAVLAGLYVAWKNLTASKEGQVTERFYRAIEQLGATELGSTDNEGLQKVEPKPKLELRLGGIYALERIAHDSEKDHWPIMEILTAYVRENAQWKVGEKPKTDFPADPLRTDIQAILTVICRRKTRYEKSDQTLDLRETDLRRARLRGARLQGARLEHMYLRAAHLERAILSNAHLSDTDLDGAHLDGAYLGG